MSLLKQRIFFAIIFIGCLTSAKSQGLKDKIIIGHGFAFYSDFFKGPSSLYTEPDYYDPTILKTSIAHSSLGVSIATYILNSRFIIKEISKNSSVSIDVPVSIGVAIYEGGFGSFTLPLMLGFNYGNVSTYTADKDKGFVIGAGVQFVKAGLVSVNSETHLKTSWVEPCMNIGYRYWNKKNKAKEINIKLGYNPGSTIVDPNGGGYNASTGSFSARLAFIFYPKY